MSDDELEERAIEELEWKRARYEDTAAVYAGYAVAQASRAAAAKEWFGTGPADSGMRRVNDE